MQPGGRGRLVIDRRALLGAIAGMLAVFLVLAAGVSWVLHSVGLVPSEPEPVSVSYDPYDDGVPLEARLPEGVPERLTPLERWEALVFGEEEDPEPPTPAPAPPEPAGP